MSGPPPAGPTPTLGPMRDALYTPDFLPVPLKGAVLPCGKKVGEKPWDKPCCVKSLSVQCGHGKRGFVLVPPTTKTNAAHEQVIQILGDHADHDTLKITFGGGPCNKGKGPYLPAVVVGDRRSPSSTTMSLAAPKAFAGPLYLHDFMQKVLGNNPLKTANVLSGSVDCCKGGQEFAFRVEVFPYRKWAGKISIGHELGTATTLVEYMDISNPAQPKAKKAKLYSIEDRGTFKITGSLDVKFGSRTSKVELPTFEKAGKGRTGAGPKVFSGTKHFFERVLPRLHTLCSSPLVTIKPLWPSLSLSGELETIEVKGQYNVAREGKVAFAAEPLLGLSGSTDLLNWLIVGGAAAFGAPTAGLQLAKIKAKAEEGFGSGRFGGKVVCKIEFTASGQIGGALEWQYKVVGRNSVSGAITADLDFELKGEVSAEVRFLQVSYTAGASISGKTGVGGELKCTYYGDDPGFAGAVKFKGLTLEAVVLHSAGGSSAGTEPSPAAAKLLRAKQNKGRVDLETSKHSDSKVLWRVEVIEACEWPNSDKAPLTDGTSP